MSPSASGNGRIISVPSHSGQTSSESQASDVFNPNWPVLWPKTFPRPHGSEPDLRPGSWQPCLLAEWYIHIYIYKGLAGVHCSSICLPLASRLLISGSASAEYIFLANLPTIVLVNRIR